MAEDKNKNPQMQEVHDLNKSLGDLQRSALTSNNFIAYSAGGVINSMLPKNTESGQFSIGNLTQDMLPKQSQPKPENQK